MGLLKNWVRHAPHASLRRRTHLNVEVLESRVVPYVTSGGAWPSPQLITISFVPDGTDLSGVSSNLFATFNAHPGWTTSTWENQILKAAQYWAMQTNINFAVVSDNGAAYGDGLYQQGDPGMGDIRVGGFNFNDPNTLAYADMPPPLNNFSIAGDIQFNTGQSFNIGTSYDLFSVSMHEIGHALGLYHTTLAPNVMQGFYQPMSRLGTDDTAGIRNIYSSNNARSPDLYNTGSSSDGSFSTATSLTSSINTTTKTALVTGLDITKPAQVEYFTFTAPSGSSSTLTVNAQSSGLSLLAPTLTVYNSSQVQIGSASGAGQYGTTLTVTVTGISAGQQFYVKVAGANNGAFGTGAYALTLNMGTGASPTVPLPNTQLLDGNPIQTGGGQPVTKPGQDNQAKDTFGVVDTDAPPQTAAPSQPVPSATAAVNPLIVATFAYGGSGQPMAVTSGVTASAPLVVTPQIAANALPIRPISANPVESGGGGNTAQPGIDDSSDVPGQPDLDITGPTSSRSQDLGGQPSTSSWRAASTACFAEENSARIAEESQEESLSLGSEDAAAILNPGAGAACLAVVLGGYWRTQPTDVYLRKLRKYVGAAR